MRSIIRITGTEALTFLQGLITNDVKKLNEGLVYAALLTPQGKYLADFFLVPQSDGSVLLDVAAFQADVLVQRMNMYKLRSDVQIEMTDLQVQQGSDPTPEDAFDDPRHPALGWRRYVSAPAETHPDYDDIRVAHCIPEAGLELGPDTFILEAGLERLNGVDFRKGCYVGQEVTARMKHKTTLRKGLVTVEIEGDADPGTPIVSGGKAAGRLHTRSGDRAIAYLRLDRASPDMRAGDAIVRYSETTG
ncbi:MAG: folate-binding protein [Pseudomonadota bacterium]